MTLSELSTNPTFSFIVPIYNTAELLPKCIESLLAQAEISIEILLIDDGSTDGSFDICKMYSARYPFIKAMTKKNEGQGVARNIGIDTAIGEFICFVDSDDWIDPIYCKTVRDAFSDASIDFINFGFEFKLLDGSTNRRFSYSSVFEMTGISIFRDSLLVNKVLTTPCGKAFRRSFLIRTGIRFPDVRKNEDIMFSCHISYAAQKAKFVPKVIYYALVRKDSTSRAMSIANYQSTEDLISREKRAFLVALTDPVTAMYFDAHIVKVFAFLLFQGAVRLSTKHEMDKAFACADRCGFKKLVADRSALRLLPMKNRVMAMATERRTFFVAAVRALHWLGLKSY